MIKKTITFSDLDGNPITEDFYFNLSKAEIAEWRIRAIKNGEDSLDDLLKRINEAKDGAVVMDTFKDLISKSVGRRSEDGRRFIKNQEIIDDFMQSDAYSVLFMELVTNAGAGAAFVNGMLPADMSQMAAEGKTLVELPKEDVKVITEKSVEQYTHQELIEMPEVEFKALLTKHKTNAPRNLLVAGMQRLSNQ